MRAITKNQANAFFFFGTIGILFSIKRYQVIDESSWIKASFLTSAVLFFPLAVFREIRRYAAGFHAPSGKYWFKLGIMWAMFYLITLVGATGALLFVNGAFDFSRPTCHDQPVIMKGGGGVRSSPQVTIQSWRPGRIDEVVLISYSLSRKLKPGTSLLRICTKPGRLGFEWVTGLAVAVEDREKIISSSTD